MNIQTLVRASLRTENSLVPHEVDQVVSAAILKSQRIREPSTVEAGSNFVQSGIIFIFGILAARLIHQESDFIKNHGVVLGGKTKPVGIASVGVVIPRHH